MEVHIRFVNKNIKKSIMSSRLTNAKYELCYNYRIIRNTSFMQLSNQPVYSE